MPYVALMIVAVLFAILIALSLQQSSAIQDQAQVLNRRSPILEWLICQDKYDKELQRLRRDRDLAQTNYLLALVDMGDKEATQQDVDAARAVYEAADARYRDQPETDCPTFVGQKDGG